MSSADLSSVISFAVDGLALSIGAAVLIGMLIMNRRARRHELSAPAEQPRQVAFAHEFLHRPTTWLAIRSVNPEAVQSALGLSRLTRCSWLEGINGNFEFFISPRVSGWVIVTGLGLPNPTDDVDACFLFLTAVSRKLGHVQYFYADRFLHHHGWARMDEGCVTRAYAWTGETVWNQGTETLPEIELALKCFSYGDTSATASDAEANFERVPSLAARWSLDPAEIKSQFVRHATGIAGESARIY